VVANRVGELGFLAQQRPNEDVIDVYEVSPYDLGRAIADAVALTKPGCRSEIVIPEYAPAVDDAYAAGDLRVHVAVDRTTTEVRRADVTAFATVQSHWRPTRRWGFDPGKNGVVWVRIKDDGEYIYATDFSLATPMSRRTLAERTDKLIAEDVKVLRDFRSS
jgi:hypothetical protein